MLYLSPEFKQVHAIYKTGEIQDLVDRILALAGESAAVAILEGTGTYSYFWKEQLQKKVIFVLVADQEMVKSTRRSLGGTDNKDDEFDASSDVPIVSSSLSRNLRSPILGQGIKLESTRHPPYITRASKQPPASKPVSSILSRDGWRGSIQRALKSNRNARMGF